MTQSRKQLPRKETPSKNTPKKSVTHKTRPKAAKQKPTRTKAEQRAEMLENILDAAELLFSRYGLYGVTLRDVADEVGVHSSLMHYYTTER